jgi:hypothetical protein
MPLVQAETLGLPVWPVQRSRHALCVLNSAMGENPTDAKASPQQWHSPCLLLPIRAIAQACGEY